MVDLVAARSVLREVIALADQASGLTDEQLRFRLRAGRTCHTPVTRCTQIPDRPLVEP